MTAPDLAALSAAATQERNDRKYYNSGVDIGRAVPHFHAALEAAYRAGRLVLIDEGMRERVAVAISGAPFPSAASIRKADAAIAAMKGE